MFSLKLNHILVFVLDASPSIYKNVDGRKVGLVYRDGRRGAEGSEGGEQGRAFIILLMQIEWGQQEERENPFEIIHNARSIRSSRSRKSSISIIDREKPRPKTKKLRKMTLNPESIRFEEIKEIEELHNENKAVRSVKGEKDPQEYNIDDFLELGGPRRRQSELQLENGIFIGIGCERDLDSDFDLSGSQHNLMGMELEMAQ